MDALNSLMANARQGQGLLVSTQLLDNRSTVFYHSGHESTQITGLLGVDRALRVKGQIARLIT